MNKEIVSGLLGALAIAGAILLFIFIAGNEPIKMDLCVAHYKDYDYCKVKYGQD